MKKITNMLKDVVAKAQAERAQSQGTEATPQNMPSAGSGVIAKALNRRNSGGFSGVINKARDAVQAAQANKKPFKSGGSVKSKASSRGDGCATKGKTKGRMI